MRTRQCKIDICNANINEVKVSENQPTFWSFNYDGEEALNFGGGSDNSMIQSRHDMVGIEQNIDNCHNYNNVMEDNNDEDNNNNLSGDPELGMLGESDDMWYNNNQNHFEPGFGQRVDDNNEEEIEVDVVSKSYTWNTEGSGIRKRRKNQKNGFKIIVARELIKRYCNYNDIRSFNDLRAMCRTMTREERYSLFNVFTNLDEQDEQVSSRKNRIIPIIFDLDKLPNNDKEDCNVI